MKKPNIKELEKIIKSGEYRGYVYQSSKTKTKDPYLPNFKKIEYSIGDYRFVDRYTGGERFAGEEVIFYLDMPLYISNYFGYIMEDSFDLKVVYDFLSKALTAGHGKGLFRGLDGFEEGHFKYRNNIKGDLQLAIGDEEILHKNKRIYILYYHGGIIRDSRKEWDWNL